MGKQTVTNIVNKVCDLTISEPVLSLLAHSPEVVNRLLTEKQTLEMMAIFNRYGMQTNPVERSWAMHYGSAGGLTPDGKIIIEALRQGVQGFPLQRLIDALQSELRLRKINGRWVRGFFPPYGDQQNDRSPIASSVSAGLNSTLPDQQKQPQPPLQPSPDKDLGRKAAQSARRRLASWSQPDTKPVRAAAQGRSGRSPRGQTTRTGNKKHA